MHAKKNLRYNIMIHHLLCPHFLLIHSILGVSFPMSEFQIITIFPPISLFSMISSRNDGIL